jgi:Zn-dependent peptidase ImmA (M78 family)
VDVFGIARELGLNVWSMNSLPSNVSGKIFRDPLNGGLSGFSIAVNGNDHPLRQRFTVAHEIGHFILHRSRLESGDLIDDAMYRSGMSSKEEAAANRLAADILMPHALIRALVAEGVREVEILANRLQVSLPAMKIRLGIPVT